MPEDVRQLERELRFLKRRQRFGFMLGFTLLFVALGFLTDLLIGVFIDKIPFMDFLKIIDGEGRSR